MSLPTEQQKDQLVYALQLRTAGEFSKAIKILHNLKSQREKDLFVLTITAEVCYEGGYFAEAISVINDMLSVDPNHEKALCLYGVCKAQMGEHKSAIDFFSRAIHVNNNNQTAFYNRGLANLELNQLKQALLDFDTSICIDSKNSNAFNNHGKVLHLLGRQSESKNSYLRAVTLNPENFEAIANLAKLENEIGNFDSSIKLYERAIEINPAAPQVHNDLGLVFMAKNEFKAAIECFQKALNIKPDFSPSIINIGNASKELKDIEKSIFYYDKFISLNPSSPEGWFNKGNALQDLQKYELAIDCYKLAIQLNPDYAEAHWNLALLLLLTGDLEEGFKEYEWRWKRSDGSSSKSHVRTYEQPQWDGTQDLQNKVVYIYPEQGFGDFIQFCRYLPLLHNKGASVILETPFQLSKLIKQSFPMVQVVDSKAVLNDFDYHVPIMSLPFAFKTRLSDIPSSIPYIKTTKNHPGLKDKANKGNSLDIGIAWSGDPRHPNDSKRSIKLKEMSSLFNERHKFHVIQKHITEADMDFLSNFNNVYTYSKQLSDFSDTATLTSEMDLVITVDTSVAHLSGALGKETFLLLPEIPDWRWLVETNKSPWYPTFTLYRKEQNSSWKKTIGKIAHELGAY